MELDLETFAALSAELGDPFARAIPRSRKTVSMMRASIAASAVGRRERMTADPQVARHFAEAYVQAREGLIAQRRGGPSAAPTIGAGRDGRRRPVTLMAPSQSGHWVAGPAT